MYLFLFQAKIMSQYLVSSTMGMQQTSLAGCLSKTGLGKIDTAWFLDTNSTIKSHCELSKAK